MFIFLFSYRPLVAPGCGWLTPVPKVIDRREDVLGTRAKRKMLLFPKISYIFFSLRKKNVDKQVMENVSFDGVWVSKLK